MCLEIYSKALREDELQQIVHEMNDMITNMMVNIQKVTI